MINRRNKKAESEKQDRWLITYADMITLLLALIIVLYAMSQVDTSKYEALRISLANEFNTPALINLEEPSPPSNPNGYELGETDPLEDQLIDPNDQNQPGQGLDETNDENEALDLLYQQLQAFIQENHLQNKITLTNQPEGISISLQEILLFDSGSAAMKEEGTPYLTTIAEMLQPLNNEVSIEGHTDKRPINTSRFPSNWELSAARALTVLHFLSEQGIQPSRLKAVGYGEYRPVDNANLHRNRRVDLIVLRESSSIK